MKGLATMENKKLIKKLKKEQNDLNEKLHKLDLFITKRDDSDRVNFSYCPICGGYLYKRKDDEHEH